MLSSALRDEVWAADNSLEMVISQTHLTPPQTEYVTIPQAWINCFISTVVIVAGSHKQFEAVCLPHCSAIARAFTAIES